MDTNEYYSIIFRLCDFELNQPPLCPSDYNLVNGWRESINYLSSKDCYGDTSVLIELPCSKIFRMPTGINEQVMTIIMRWSQGANVETYCYKGTAFSRWKSRESKYTYLMLADMSEDPDNRIGIIRLSFATKSTLVGGYEHEMQKRPIELVMAVVRFLSKTYTGIPFTTWSICPLCKEKMAPWENQIPPLPDEKVLCLTCKKWHMLPNFQYWPR